MSDIGLLIKGVWFLKLLVQFLPDLHESFIFDQKFKRLSEVISDFPS